MFRVTRAARISRAMVLLLFFEIKKVEAVTRNFDSTPIFAVSICFPFAACLRIYGVETDFLNMILSLPVFRFRFPCSFFAAIAILMWFAWIHRFRTCPVSTPVARWLRSLSPNSSGRDGLRVPREAKKRRVERSGNGFGLGRDGCRGSTGRRPAFGFADESGSRASISGCIPFNAVSPHENRLEHASRQPRIRTCSPLLG